jgi:uncharacterized protein (TIGR02466 family)
MAIKLESEILFPNVLWSTTELDVDRKWLKDYTDICRKEDPDGVIKSNGGGWQSQEFTNDKFEHPKMPPEMKNFKDKLDEVVFDASNQMGFPKLIMGSIWFNINGYKDHNKEHTHPRSLISGVYYPSISEPDKMGDIIFVRSDGGSVYISHNIDYENYKTTSYTGSIFSYPPEDGLLLLFPSWMIHSVDSNNSKYERYSISFNYVVSN